MQTELVMIEEEIFRNVKKKICLIDNYTHKVQTDRIERITNIIQENFKNIEINLIHHSRLNLSKLKGISGYILSGSDSNVSEFYSNKILRNEYKQELKLIKKQKEKPILAICYAHQLTAYAFGGEIQRMSGPNMGSRIIKLKIDKVDEFIPYDELLVNVHHQDYVIPEDSRIKKNFNILSTKERNGYNTIQYMRHYERPIFSVQFHPETHHSSKYVETYDEQKINKTKLLGEDIIKNFVSLCVK